MAENYRGGVSYSNLMNKIDSEGSQEITKLIKSGGEIVGYELASGMHVSVHQAVDMAKHHQLKHVDVTLSQDGNECIHALDNLPSITADYR